MSIDAAAAAPAPEHAQFSLGRGTTREEIDAVAEQLIAVLATAR